MRTIELMYLVSGALLAILGIPLIMRKIKPNWIYGFRTPATLANHEMWYDINAYFGRWMVAISVPFLLLTIILPLIPGITVEGYAGIASIVILGGLGLGLWFSFQRIRNYGK